MPILTNDPFMWLTEEVRAAIEVRLAKYLEPKTPPAPPKTKSNRVAFLEPLVPVTTPPSARPAPSAAAPAATEPKPSLKIRVPKIDTVHCPDCSHEMLDDAQYCDSCEQCLWCHDCDSMRESGDRFCGPCRYEYNADRNWRCGY